MEKKKQVKRAIPFPLFTSIIMFKPVSKWVSKCWCLLRLPAYLFFGKISSLYDMEDSFVFVFIILPLSVYRKNLRKKFEGKKTKPNNANKLFACDVLWIEMSLSICFRRLPPATSNQMTREKNSITTRRVDTHSTKIMTKIHRKLTHDPFLLTACFWRLEFNFSPCSNLIERVCVCTSDWRRQFDFCLVFISLYSAIDPTTFFKRLFS